MPRRNWLPILATAGFLALPAGAAAQSVEQPIDDNQARAERPEERSAEPTQNVDPATFVPLQNAIERVAGALEAASDKPESAEERERAERDLDAQEGMAKWAEWMFWVALVAAVLAFASVVLTGIGIWLIWQTLEYTAVAARQAKRAADYTGGMLDEAKKSTEAAIEAAGASQETVRSDRAWMSYTDFHQWPIGNSQIEGVQINDGYAVSVGWLNTGRTPAINARAVINCKLVPIGDTDIPYFSVRPSESEGAVIGPNIPIQTARFFINDSQYRVLKKNKAKMFIYSRVEYSDIYSPKESRFTEACIEAIVDGFFEGKDGKPQPHFGFGPRGPQNTYG